MKATGIVRRIDDLGRIVIPKEIRRTMRIREGDPSLNTLIQSEVLAVALDKTSGKTLLHKDQRPPERLTIRQLCGKIQVTGMEGTT